MATFHSPTTGKTFSAKLSKLKKDSKSSTFSLSTRKIAFWVGALIFCRPSTVNFVSLTYLFLYSLFLEKRSELWKRFFRFKENLFRREKHFSAKIWWQWMVLFCKKAAKTSTFLFTRSNEMNELLFLWTGNADPPFDHRSSVFRDKRLLNNETLWREPSFWDFFFDFGIKHKKRQS